MRTIRDALGGLRRELEQALAETQSGSNLLPERVVINLRVTMTDEGGWVAESESLVDPAVRGPGHSVCLEFRVASAGMKLEPSTAPGLVAGIKPSNPLDGEAAQKVVSELSRLFGVPGFDSSARATVFREALEGLPSETILEAVGLLADPRAPQDPTVRQARHRLLGLVRSGPLGSPVQAVELLGGIFRQFPPTNVVRLVLETWKTQDDWL